LRRNGTNGGNGTKPEVTVGIVGLGYWGPNLLRVLAEMPGIDVRWICDQDGERLDRFARRYPAMQPTQEFGDVIDDPAVDAVIIATPVFTHFELASRSLRAGKHTFVEKPLAASVEEADTLLEIADERDCRLMCGHTFLYSPPVRAVKKLLDTGELGDIHFISSSRVNLGLHQPDVSVVWDLAPHDFSILLYWLDELPTSVGAVGRDSVIQGLPDVAFVNLGFPSGIIANMELSWLAPSKLRRTVIVGSEKMVVYDDVAPEPIRIFDHGVVYEDPEDFGQYQLSYRTGDILSPRLDVVEPLAVELEHFRQGVLGEVSIARDVAIARDVVALTEEANRQLTLETGRSDSRTYVGRSA
jgi:predicted dehydrogenase